ncbi:hypothetical protein Plhal304r1_c036g0110261 [Plasmopara halstedii]
MKQNSDAKTCLLSVSAPVTKFQYVHELSIMYFNHNQLCVCYDKEQISGQQPARKQTIRSKTCESCCLQYL